MSEYQCIEFNFLNIKWAGILLPPPDNRVCSPTSILAGLIGIEPKHILQNYNNNPNRFSPLKTKDITSRSYLSIDEISAKESLSSIESAANGFTDLVRDNKKTLNIQRLRSDMFWWPEEDMYTHAMICNSERSWQFKQALAAHLREYRIAQIPPNYIPVEQLLALQDKYETALSERGTLQQRLDRLESQMTEIQKKILPIFELQVPIAGMTLEASKQLSKIRKDN